jgi:hypothetical protein
VHERKPSGGNIIIEFRTGPSGLPIDTSAKSSSRPHKRGTHPHRRLTENCAAWPVPNYNRILGTSSAQAFCDASHAPKLRLFIFRQPPNLFPRLVVQTSRTAMLRAIERLRSLKQHAAGADETQAERGSAGMEEG